MRAGLTQEELADRLGIAVKNLQRIESGRQNLTLRTVARICRAAGVDAEHVLAPLVDPRVFHLGSAMLSSSASSPPRAVPLFRLAGAAAYAKSGARTDVVGWALVGQPVDERHFIAHVDGDAMAPEIPPGSWNLFRAVKRAVRGRVVLVEISGGTGGAELLVRRLRTSETRRGRVHAVFDADNAAYPPLAVDGVADGHCRILAEHVAVITV